MLFGVGQIFAQSQASTGQITGVVADANGAVVPNATVTVTSKDTNATQTATTSDEGIYRFVLLQPGDYTLKASAASFAEQTLNVTVFVGRTVDANFALGAGNVGAEVTITAEGVQTTTSNFDAVQTDESITNLPINGRKFQDFATLTPSAQVDPSRGQISLSGQRGINFNINVDGLDFTQPFFGGIRGGERSNSAPTIPQESVREFQVISAGYSAEFGRSSGGVISVVTKSGTNNMRGSAYYLIRPEKLARANSFAKALADQRLNALGLDATLAPTQQQFGGSLGGPLIKDKLFYFASYEQQRFRAPRQVFYNNINGFTPTASQTEGYNFYNNLEVPYEATNDAIVALGKIDWNINNSNRFNVRYNFSDNNALNAVSTGETALDPTTTNSLSTNGTEKNRNHGIVSQLISSFTPNVSNEARFQYAYEERPRIPNEIVSNINTAIGVYGTRNFLPTTQFDKRIQFADSLTMISGNHTLKFGGEFSNIYANQTFGFNQTGVFTFAGLTATAGILDAISTVRTATYRGRFDTATARYNKQIGNLAAAYTVRELAFFAQDAWRITPKLTFNYGLRYEKQFNPTSEANNTPVLNLIKNTAFPILGNKGIDPAAIPDSQNQWGPRVGFAYDPNGDGKTVIRGFAGMYYARTPLLGLAAPFNNFRDPAGDLSVTIGSTAFNATGFNQATFETQNPQYVAIVGTGFAPNTVYRQFAILGIDLNASPLTNLPVLTPAQLGTIADRIRAATTNPAASLGVYQNANFVGIVPNYKNPQSFQFGGGVEREIAQGTVIGLDYSQVNTIYLQRNTDINIPAPTGTDTTTGRVLVNRALRPLPQLGTIQLRDSSARSLYRALTFRFNTNKKWGRINAYYTLSKSLSDDDNERDAGGVLYDNPYNLRNEYYLSNLDRRHQFVANPVFYLPYSFEVSSAVRLRSGRPFESRVGTDLNGDNNTNERPFVSVGVELPRNYFINRPLFDVDLRVQKSFKFSESRRLSFSAEFFNILNRSNLQFSGNATTNYCATSNARCGLDGITNLNFKQIIQQTTTATNFGKLNLAGLNPGSQVFQMQLGARFYF
ncbi:MAG TPA: TonB-dependent receptor [Pyrinomonadaceae bacterium]|nr:TonB-dependent receptor [Pyrinomonadaceae bacterium]